MKIAARFDALIESLSAAMDEPGFLGCATVIALAVSLAIFGPQMLAELFRNFPLNP